MKEIKTRYSKKLVGGKFYSQIEITPKETTNDDSGYIYVPYIIGENAEKSKEYKDFMKIYHEEHKFCPKCGSSGEYSITLMGYILNIDKKEDYKDLNSCKCQKCGDVHTFHERIKNFIV